MIDQKAVQVKPQLDQDAKPYLQTNEKVVSAKDANLLIVESVEKQSTQTNSNQDNRSQSSSKKDKKPGEGQDQKSSSPATKVLGLPGDNDVDGLFDGSISIDNI